MDPGLSSIFFIKNKSIFHVEDADKLYTSPSSGSIADLETKEDDVEFKSCCFRCLSITYNYVYYFFVYPYKIVVNESDHEKPCVKLVASGIRLVIERFNLKFLATKHY